MGGAAWNSWPSFHTVHLSPRAVQAEDTAGAAEVTPIPIHRLVWCRKETIQPLVVRFTGRSAISFAIIDLF